MDNILWMKKGENIIIFSCEYTLEIKGFQWIYALFAFLQCAWFFALSIHESYVKNSNLK